MLHHVSLEIAPDQLDAALEFWVALGFARIDPPESVTGPTAWLESEGAQIHLMAVESPMVPAIGHVALIVSEFAEAVTRLTAAGFEVEPRHEHWGQPRVFVTAPGGHRVELMGAGPQT